MDSISKTLITVGSLCVVGGLIWHFFGGNIPFGKLPGDIRIQSEHTKIYIPLTSGLILSGLLSLLSYLFRN
jgi:hypothetical protein